MTTGVRSCEATCEAARAQAAREKRREGGATRPARAPAQGLSSPCTANARPATARPTDGGGERARRATLRTKDDDPGASEKEIAPRRREREHDRADVVLRVVALPEVARAVEQVAHRTRDVEPEALERGTRVQRS